MSGIKYFLAGLAVTIFVYIMYLGTQMSVTYGPLKIYHLKLSENEIYTQRTKISDSKQNLKIIFSDSIGTAKDQRDYHCDMSFKDKTNEYHFHFIYKRSDANNADLVTEIELISANDYKLQIDVHDIDHEEAPRLVRIFEAEIINKLVR